MTCGAYDSGERVIVEVDFDAPVPLLLLTIGTEEDPFRLTEVEAERVILGLQEGLKVVRSANARKVVRSANARPSPSTP